MIGRRGIALVVLALMVAMGWTGATVGRRLYADYAAGQWLKPLVSDGHRLVPVREYRDMRGEPREDFRCFADGACFYAIGVFRRLYPAYNDLDDDALLAELRGRNAQPRRRFTRTRALLRGNA